MKPTIVPRILTPDHWDYGNGPRDGESIVGLVYHCADGNGSLYNWFQSQQLSTHYWVSKAGVIEQYVPDEHAAYAQGRISLGSDFPAWAYVGTAPNGRRINDRALSVEMEGHPFDGFPEPQITAAIALGRYLVRKHGIPVDRDHVVGHYRFDHASRANCPGPKFPWDRVMAGLA